jgi:SAM-dependent methyltransferase
MAGGSLDRDTDEVINFAAYMRRAWIAEKAAKLRAGSKVLDAGAGECQYRELFAHCAYKAQDFAQYKGTDAGPQKERWSYGTLDYVCDISAIPVGDGEFDAVLCTEVLEHVPKPIDALCELSRVLRSGGTLLLTAPLASGLHQRPHHYYGGYTPHFYETFLPLHGLEIRELKPIGGLMLHTAQEIFRVGHVLESSPTGLTPWMRLVLKYWLPRYLAAKEAGAPVDEFTVGYMVRAEKRS